MLHAPEIYKYKLIWVKSKATNFLNAKKQPLRKYEDICVFYKAQPTYNPQMSEGEAYDKGVRKDQLTGSYGAFSPKHVKSDGSRYPTDIVYFKTAESEGAVYHPTQKPVELGRYLIRTYTNPGDIVLDNACGSGSFCVAAVLEGRSFIGIEKNEDVALFKKQPVDYIDICNQRIKALAIKLDHRVLKNTGTNDANEFLFCRFRQTAGIHLEHSVVSIRIRFRCDRSRYRTETKLFHLFLHHFIDKEIGKRLRAVPTINFCRTV